MDEMEEPTKETPGRTILCKWCGGPVRQTGVGRRREYCGQSCRQRVYETRRALGRVAEDRAERETPSTR